MAYGESKVYYDGSHYIAIPHTTRPSFKRPKPPEEEIEVLDSTKEENIEESSPSNIEGEPFQIEDIEEHTESEREDADEPLVNEPKTHPKPKKTTRKQLFEDAYAESLNIRKSLRPQHIFKALRPYFTDDTKCMEYVTANIERKQRNLICRRIRMCRKANLQDFNYFCTFTYNDEIHTEESFKKQIKRVFNNFCSRKDWKYMGVWERSPKKKRLHFHGLFNIPEGTLPGMMIQTNDYSFSEHKRRITNQSIFFIERFGRNDFEPITDKTKMGHAMGYLMKYLEKTGEKIVYAKGMPQYFISDILEEDVVCRIGQEDKKLLLFDDFSCFDEGVYIGQVSKETIAQMRKVS